MYLGIISDIHGDFDALATALDRLDHEHHADHILCAGDLIGRGPQQNDVVALVRERGIVTVKGNHDDWNPDLSEESRRFLNNLPIDWQGEYQGVSVFMTHGKPGNNMWGMYRDHLSDTYLTMVLRALRTRVLITGHTHMPLFMRVNGGCLVNPGSLYTFSSPRKSSHTYGLLRLPQMEFQVFDVLRTSPTPLTWESIRD